MVHLPHSRCAGLPHGYHVRRQLLPRISCGAHLSAYRRDGENPGSGAVTPASGDDNIDVVCGDMVALSTIRRSSETQIIARLRLGLPRRTVGTHSAAYYTAGGCSRRAPRIVLARTGCRTHCWRLAGRCAAHNAFYHRVARCSQRNAVRSAAVLGTRVRFLAALLAASRADIADNNILRVRALSNINAFMDGLRGAAAWRCGA